MTFKEASWDWVQDTVSATAKWGSIGDWDVSSVKDFSWAFSRDRNTAGSYVLNGNPKARTFIGTDISKWITTSVTSMYYAFFHANEMNPDLSKWNVAKVESLGSTFKETHKFAGIGLNSWITTSVKNLDGTFDKAGKMNADLSGWSVGQVTNMNNMFLNAAGLTSCIKRKIADAWKSSSIFVATTYDTDWAGETCPKVRDGVRTMACDSEGGRGGVCFWYHRNSH